MRACGFICKPLYVAADYDFEVENCNLKMKKRETAKLLTIPKRGALASQVESRILFLRHQRVILDKDLGELYGVPVRHLNQQIKRNQQRFPSDFMFQLTDKEHRVLRSQIVISRKGSGGRRYAPYAFTEHGAIMAATVLNSQRAIQMSVFVVRAFVRLREMLSANRQFAAKWPRSTAGCSGVLGARSGGSGAGAMALCARWRGWGPSRWMVYCQRGGLVRVFGWPFQSLNGAGCHHQSG